MRELKSQQLASFYLSVIFVAIIAVWILSSGGPQQNTNASHTLCVVKAKPEFQLKINFNPQDQNKRFSKNLTKKAYPFKIITISKNLNPTCLDKVGKIFPVYLHSKQKIKLQTQSLVRLKLVLYVKRSLVSTTGNIVWQLIE